MTEKDNDGYDDDEANVVALSAAAVSGACRGAASFAVRIFRR